MVDVSGIEPLTYSVSSCCTTSVLNIQIGPAEGIRTPIGRFRRALPCPVRPQPVINIVVKTYQNLTPGGLHFHLSLSDTGVCCIVVHDVFYCDTQIRYFTNVNKALRFINNL